MDQESVAPPSEIVVSPAPVAPVADPPVVPISYTDKLKSILSRPNISDEVFAHIANGGSLINLAENLDIRYSDLRLWVMAEPARSEMLAAAIESRQDWMKQRVLDELRHIALIDIRLAFTDDGKVKPPKEWPDSIARALASFEIEEIYQKGQIGPIGKLSKLKFNSKIEALKLIGQEYGLFVQRHNVKIEKSIEEMVAGSFEAEVIPQPAEPATQPTTEEKPT